MLFGAWDRFWIDALLAVEDVVWTLVVAEAAAAVMNVQEAGKLQKVSAAKPICADVIVAESMIEVEACSILTCLSQAAQRFPTALSWPHSRLVAHLLTSALPKEERLWCVEVDEDEVYMLDYLSRNLLRVGRDGWCGRSDEDRKEAVEALRCWAVSSKVPRARMLIAEHVAETH